MKNQRSDTLGEVAFAYRWQTGNSLPPNRGHTVMILTRNFVDMKSRVEEHVAAWDGLRGCFIGCLAHKNSGPEAVAYNEATYDLPVMVQRIAENIFNALYDDDAKVFFATFPDVVECDGKDLSRVGWQFLGAELRECAKLATRIALEAVNRVIAGTDLLSEGKGWPDVCTTYTANAVYATRFSSYVNYAAAYAADAVAAAYAPSSAVCAAHSAAEAINFLAHDVNGFINADARLRQRDTLLRLIKEAPVVENVS